MSTTLLLKTNFLVSKRNLLLNSFFSWPLRPPSSSVYVVVLKVVNQTDVVSELQRLPDVMFIQ